MTYLNLVDYSHKTIKNGPMRTPDTCPDPACQPCLDHERRASLVRMELLLLDAEVVHPDDAWIDSTPGIDALNVRNVLDLVKGV